MFGQRKTIKRNIKEEENKMNACNKEIFLENAYK